MIQIGTLVEVHEDPITMTRKEGNAWVIEHVVEIEPGLNQYLVNFVGDRPGDLVARTISDLAVMQTTLDQMAEFITETKQMVGGSDAG